MKKILFLLVLFSISPLSAARSIPIEVSKSDFVLGQSLTIRSNVLSEERDLNIYLPASYFKEERKSYPVIYLFDGSKDEDFIHVAGIVQFGSFSWIKMLPESIVVGIGNVDRKRDFTYPSNSKLDQKEFPTSGHSKVFIEFIEKELQPFINSKFRTESLNTVIGQSLGGLLATEILFKKPDLFDNYIIVSPSLWWDDENLLATELANYNSGKSIYIAVGDEGEVMKRTAKALFTKLSEQRKLDAILHFEYLADKNHGDALHTAVYNAFEWLFSSRNK